MQRMSDRRGRGAGSRGDLKIPCQKGFKTLNLFMLKGKIFITPREAAPRQRDDLHKQ